MIFLGLIMLSIYIPAVAARYREEGTTTSPFDMMLCNQTSRYHVAAAAIRGGAVYNPKISLEAHELASYVMHLAQKDKESIYANSKGGFS